MSTFFYKNKNTFFHGLDPRIKIICLLLFFLDAIIIKNITGMLILFLVILILFIFSDSLYSLKKILFLFLLVGVITFILWVIFYNGKEVGDIYKKMNYAGFLTLRLLNMLLAGLLFLSITSFEDFSYGLMLFGLPYSVAFTVLLSFKLVDSFMKSAFLIVEAQRARGNDITKGNILKRIKSYTPLVIPLILNGIKKAQNLVLALETRGFSPKNRINLDGKYKIKIIDIIFLILFILSSFTIFFINL